MDMPYQEIFYKAWISEYESTHTDEERKESLWEGIGFSGMYSYSFSGPQIPPGFFDQPDDVLSSAAGGGGVDPLQSQGAEGEGLNLKEKSDLMA